MNAFSAVDWFVIATFAAGSLLGLAAGWLLRGWRQDDGEAPVERAPE